LSTHQLVIQSTHHPYFVIFSAQSSTQKVALKSSSLPLGRKNGVLQGVIKVKMGTAHNCVQAILILHKYTNDAKQLRFAPKSKAKCSKTRCKVPQNAVQSTAKRKVKCSKTQGKTLQNAG